MNRSHHSVVGRLTLVWIRTLVTSNAVLGVTAVSVTSTGPRPEGFINFAACGVTRRREPNAPRSTTAGRRIPSTFRPYWRSGKTQTTQWMFNSDDQLAELPPPPPQRQPAESQTWQKTQTLLTAQPLLSHLQCRCLCHSFFCNLCFMSTPIR